MSSDLSAKELAIELERKNLEAHVAISKLRYDNLERRLEMLDGQFNKIEQRFDSIENKMTSIREDIHKNQLVLTKTMLGTAGTILVALISSLGLYFSK